MATPEEAPKVRKRARMERSVLIALVLVILSGATSFILAVTFAQHAADDSRAQARRDAAQAQASAEQFTRQFCKVIVLLDDQYKALPQNKLTQGQKDFIAAMIQLREDYRCDDK